MSALDERLADGVRSGVFPAAQAVVLHRDQSVWSGVAGRVAETPVTDDTLFDVASVTKLVATTLAVAYGVSEGALRLDDPVCRALPAFASAGKTGVTVRDLLAHSSGLPAWRPFFTDLCNDPVAGHIFPGYGAGRVSREAAFTSARSRVLDAVYATPLEHAPGTRVYSDLGFIVLGELIAAVAGESLDAICARAIFASSGAPTAQFVDLRTEQRPTAPVACTGRTRPREPAPGQEDLFTVPAQDPRCVPAEVDDDNAYALAGVAGHAGVFSTARDIARLGQVLLQDVHGAGRLMTADVARQFVRGLGVERVSAHGSSAGTRFGRGRLGGVGHLGFTGCSVWVDLDEHLVVALLTNRTLPGRDNLGIKAFRPAFHDAVVAHIERSHGS